MDILQSVIEGLQIMSKYEDVQIYAQHDIIYAGPDPTDDVTEEDVAKLEELGWRWVSSEGSWGRFV